MIYCCGPFQIKNLYNNFFFYAVHKTRSFASPILHPPVKLVCHMHTTWVKMFFSKFTSCMGPRKRIARNSRKAYVILFMIPFIHTGSFFWYKIQKKIKDSNIIVILLSVDIITSFTNQHPFSNILVFKLPFIFSSCT